MFFWFVSFIQIYSYILTDSTIVADWDIPDR